MDMLSPGDVSAPGSLLIVDDDAINRAILDNLFAPFYPIEEAEDGEQVYNFRLSYVTDSELKSACELHSDIAQQRLPVTFWLKKLKDGKLVATDIQLDREAYQARQAAEAADGAAEEAPAEAETPEAAEPQAAETPEAE